MLARLRAWWFRCMVGELPGRFHCPVCGGKTVDHCAPYRWRVGDQHRTGTMQCKWRMCQLCGAYGVPGGRWVSRVPKEET